MKIYKSVEELVGKTPLVELSRFGEGLDAKIFAKIEFMNPAGSIKDRAAKSMLDDAEKRGILNKNLLFLLNYDFVGSILSIIFSISESSIVSGQ